MNIFGKFKKLVLASSILLASNAFGKYELAVECKDTEKGNSFSAMDIYPNKWDVFQFQGTHLDLPAGKQNFHIFQHYPVPIMAKINQFSPEMAELVFPLYIGNPELIFEGHSRLGRVKNLVILNLHPELFLPGNDPVEVKVKLTIKGESGVFEGEKVLEFEGCQLLRGIPMDSWQSAFGVN